MKFKMQNWNSAARQSVTNWLWHGPMYSTERSRPDRQLNLASAQRLRYVRPSKAQTGPCHDDAGAALRRCLTTPERPRLTAPWPRRSVRQSAAQTQRGWPCRIRHTLLEPSPPHWKPSHEAALHRPHQMQKTFLIRYGTFYVLTFCKIFRTLLFRKNVGDGIHVIKQQIKMFFFLSFCNNVDKRYRTINIHRGP